MSKVKVLSFTGDALVLLDQRRLPSETVYLTCKTSDMVADAIRTLAVRGAPLIGVAAAYAVVLAFRESVGNQETFQKLCDMIRNARPTAVNLSWAVSEMEIVFRETPTEAALLEKAVAIEKEDEDICRKIGENGADLFRGREGLSILTHCNSGALATAGIGTALGVLSTLHARGQIKCIYADETRPLLQGARLTAYELTEGKIPCCLISDNMAASVLRDKHIDAVITGADRIAKNGDTANKIGTFGLAVLAHYFGIPLYIAAPFSTFDFSITSGAEIPIEERDADEIRKIGDIYVAPVHVPVYNPAFDVTPASLISGIITEKGVLAPPYEISVSQYERSFSHD